MRNIDSRTSRRRFMRVSGAGLAALPFAGLIPVQAVNGAELVPVTADDPVAIALAYVETSTVPGQQCNNCALWLGGDADRGGCQIFPAKSVTAKGWCKSWAKKE